MEHDLFNDLVQSLKEAKDIAQGKTEASRRITITPDIGMSVKTLRNVESPAGGPSAALLNLSLPSNRPNF